MTEGYGKVGFQSSGTFFSGPGCWEVIGRIDGRELRFVVLVRDE